MMSGKKTICIADVKSIIDEEGDRTKIVSHGTKLVASVDLVGVQTLQLGQSQGVNLSYSIEIPRMYYKNEKYCYFENNLYKIESLTKAKLPVNMLLSVAKLEDTEVEEAIKQWLTVGGQNASIQERSNADNI